VALGLASAALMSVDAVTWGVRPFDDTSWVPSRNEIMNTVWTWVIPNRNLGAALVLACSLAAVGAGASVRARR
jgi:hypothetical protein